jgi:hypothetical protein
VVDLIEEIARVLLKLTQYETSGVYCKCQEKLKFSFEGLCME